MHSPRDTSPASPPLVAMVINVQTPYRVHAHRRIARELPQIRLATLYTHGQPDQPWQVAEVPEINPVQFGPGDPVSQQGRPRYFLRDWAKGGRIIRWLKDHRAAAVCIGGYNDPARIRLLRWCRRAGIPVFVLADSNIHDDKATGLKRLIKNAIVRWVVRQCTGVLPCGSLGAAYFERYGARPEQTFYHPYEPDYSLIAGLPRDAVHRTLTRHGLPLGRRRIVVCSRLIPHKRVDMAIDAFAAIAAERPDWDLVVIGDGPELAALKARLPAALSPRVRWAGFIGDQAEISAIYRGSDLLLHPSEYEPWAVVINEAAAAGLAIVASSVVGAAAELVREDVNGYRPAVGNLPALTEALRRATDPARIDTLKAGSAGVLADWRRRGDPVDGLRRALEYAGVLGQPQTATAHPHPLRAPAGLTSV